MVPTAEHYDVVVIGGGPGGYAAALYGAAAGLNIAMVEKDKVGGTCLHRGCIPAKELLETAATYRTSAEAKEFGVQVGEPDPRLRCHHGPQAQGRRPASSRASAALLKGRKVTVLDGHGRLGRRQAGHRDRRRRRRPRAHRRRRGPRPRLGAAHASPASTSTARSC